MLVRKFLPRDAEPGEDLVDMLGRGGTHRHNSSQGFPLPHCAVQDSGGGVPSPLAGRLTAGRDHTVLDALMKTSLRLVIHPG